MKATLHFPTEQYGFAEVELEVATPRDAIAAYQETIKSGEGLAKQDYDHFIDNMLLGEDNHVETYNQMSAAQQAEVQTIKRSIKRIKAKQQRQ